MRTFDDILSTLGVGFVSVVFGAWLSKTLGFGSAVGILVLAIVLHVLARVLGDKPMVIVVAYALGVFIAVQHGWTTLSFMPSP
ncbi:MAG TPA: hypothetical protein VJ843_05505 [Candidatus Saccharimonadales bacterium]|nr:hypothetical protein [Candidatus Saccharimonadales bacterium]